MYLFYTVAIWQFGSGRPAFGVPVSIYTGRPNTRDRNCKEKRSQRLFLREGNILSGKVRVSADTIGTRKSLSNDMPLRDSCSITYRHLGRAGWLVVTVRSYRQLRYIETDSIPVRESSSKVLLSRQKAFLSAVISYTNPSHAPFRDTSSGTAVSRDSVVE
jgi:hypothetical protein